MRLLRLKYTERTLMSRCFLAFAAAITLGASAANCGWAQTVGEAAVPAAASKTWALHDGDRVVFYGDSITEQRFYTWWAELYAVTRFPSQHVLFWNAGIGGDRVTGGFGGKIEERLDRDVFAHKPTVVTIMLGMNDGSYTALTPAIEQAYVNGYEHILTFIAANAPGARVLVIGPSAYDEVTRPPMFPGGYNATLTTFTRDDKALAAKHGAAFTDANAPFVDALIRAKTVDLLAAQLLVPDRIHPEISAHLVIAMAVLDGWQAPSLVASTAIDAANGAVLPATERTSVTGLQSSKTGLQWTSLEEALPMPLGSNHAGFNLVKQVTGWTERFNREPLTVQHLPAGSYRLRIDDVEVSTFTAEQLAAGVNLAELDTPMRRQSQVVEWAVRDKGDLQFVRTRIAIRKSSPEAGAALDKAEQQMQQMIWHDAMPAPHQFTLTRVLP